MRKEYNKIIERTTDKSGKELSILSQIEKEMNQETFPLKSYPTEETTSSDEQLNEEAKRMVTNCKKLNVRKDPNKTAEILCVIEVGTVVTINQTPSGVFDYLDDVWTHICVNGMVGYVMGEFLKEV